MSRLSTEWPGPWPDVVELIREEARLYLTDAVRVELRIAPTACSDWTGDQLTSHVAATFRRFSELLGRGRMGDFSVPFAVDELADENARAVARFSGDPPTEARLAVAAFCRDGHDPAEVMPHQFGPIPVGLQQAFGLNELAIHHDDLLASTVRRHRPSDEVIQLLVPAWVGPLRHPRIGTADDPWEAILAASGR